VESPSAGVLVLKDYFSLIVGFFRTKLRCCMILVVGCNHGIQYRQDPLCDTPQKTEQKAQFAAFIARTIKDNKIQFVGEEWGLPEVTNARAAAEANGQTLWVNINTSFDELEGMGIPNNYADGDYSAEQKARWNRQREQVMVRKLRENRGTTERLVVICGFDHMLPLTELLRQDCRCVLPMDYRTLRWYDGNAF